MTEKDPIYNLVHAGDVGGMYEDQYVKSDLNLIEAPKWIPIDEFMKSPVEGLCWITGKKHEPEPAYYSNKLFYKTPYTAWSWGIEGITHVQPIPKPEAPE